MLNGAWQSLSFHETFFSSCCWLSWVFFENKTFLNGQWVGLLSTDLCEPLAAKTESKQPPSGIGGIFCLAAFSLQFCKRLSMGVLLYCCWRLHIRGFQVPQTFSAEGAHTKHKGTHPKNMRPNVINLRNEKWRKIGIKYWSLKSIFATKSFHILQLTLLCWNLYLKQWAAFVVSAARKRGSKNRKKRASVFLLSLPPQYFTPHTQCEGIIPPHWYLSICGNYIFSCRVLAEWTLPYIVYLRCGLGAGII